MKQGVQEFYLSVCYQAKKIREHFKKSYKGAPIHYIEEPNPLGTGGAILYVLSEFKDQKSDVVVLNGDTFLELDFEKMVAFHKRSNSDVTLALRTVDQNDRYSGVLLDTENKILEFCQRQENASELIVNAGVYLLKPEILTKGPWQKGDQFSIEDDFFPVAVEKRAVYGFMTHGRFIDIGIPKDYERSKDFFKYEKQAY